MVRVNFVLGQRLRAAAAAHAAKRVTDAKTSELLGYVVGTVVSTEVYLHLRRHTMADGSVLRDDRRQEPFGVQYGGLTAEE
jgi:hypothetical protein